MSRELRKWTSSEKREVACRQEWRCCNCKQLLPATFEIDHIMALQNGGIDDLAENAQALCNVCHSKKTMSERIQMEGLRKAAILSAKEASGVSKIARTLLDPVPGADFLENKFLRFAYTPS